MPRRKARGAWPLLVAALLPLASASAEPDPTRRPEPLWEVGLGVAPLTYPQYPGSAEQETIVLPLPYVVYRGDLLRVDREGVRGLIAETPRLRLDVSVDAAAPVATEEDGARAGMNELDPVIEAGPSLVYRLHMDGPLQWRLRLPVRAAIASDLRSVRAVGWKAQPMVSADLPRGPFGWRLSASVGPEFGSRRYHAYYYSVPTSDATAHRPAYSARAGYGGTLLTLTASRRFRRFWAGAFVRYRALGGAVFEDSPLMERHSALIGGFGIAWILGQSEAIARE